MTTNVPQTTLDRLLEEEELAQLERFNYDDAHELGQWVLRLGRRDGLKIAVTINLGEQRVFSGALEGTSHDNDLWLDRKIGVVRMFAHSSFYVQHLFAHQHRDFRTESRLDPNLYAAAGGGFPIRVSGMLVGAIAISGSTESSEHSLAVEALTTMAGRQRA